MHGRTSALAGVARKKGPPTTPRRGDAIPDGSAKPTSSVIRAPRRPSQSPRRIDRPDATRGALGRRLEIPNPTRRTTAADRHGHGHAHPTATPIATPAFLASLEALYPPQPTQIDNPWYAVAAIAYSATGHPDAVPCVLAYVLRDLHDDDDDRRAVVRKMRDALFKSGLICGFPKVISALTLLHDATPPELRDKHMLRNPNPTIRDLSHAGRSYFDHTYGETANATRTLLNDIYPDLGFWSIDLAYGYAYAFTGATSRTETSFALIAALIAIDAPRQVAWHLQGAVRNGATRDEVRAVRAIAIQVARAAGVVWKEAIPDID